MYAAYDQLRRERGEVPTLSTTKKHADGGIIRRERLEEIFMGLYSGSCSKSGTRNELRKRLCPLAEGSLFPAEPAFLESIADAHKKPEVLVVDGSGRMGALQIHKSPVPEKPLTNLDQLVEWFVNQLMRPFQDSDRAIHTVAMVMDHTELVAPGKGTEQYSRSKNKSATRDKWETYILDTYGQTLEQYHGDQYYDPRHTSVDEEEQRFRVEEVDRLLAKASPERMNELMATKRKLLARRPLSKLLKRGQPIPGPFDRLYGDKVRGFPALIRFLVLSAAHDTLACCSLANAQRVIFSGHCLLPEDLLEEDVTDMDDASYLALANRVATTSLLLHNADDLETVEMFLGEKARTRLERERHEVPMHETGLPRLSMLDRERFGHRNGEADQGIYFIIRALEQHLNFQSFLLVSTDTDNIFSGPMFLLERYVMQGGKRMPAIYNDFDSGRGGPNSDPRNICSMRALLAEIQRYMYENVPYVQSRRLRVQQVQDDPSGLTALLQHAKVQPERARHEDALYAAVDSSGTHHLATIGAPEALEYDESVPLEAHFVAMLILAGTDFCKGWYYVGSGSLFDAFCRYSHQCMPLVRRSKKLVDEEGRGILEYEPLSVLRLILYMYVSKRTAAFKGEKRLLEGLQPEEIIEAVVSYQLAKYAGEMELLEKRGVDHFPEKLTAVHSAVAKCLPPTDEMVARLLNANYYLTILSQTGLANIRYRREQFSGYQKRHTDKPMSRSNIRHGYD